MFVNPADQTVVAGNNFTLNIDIADAVDVGAYEFVLTFDDALIDYVSVTNAGFLGSTGRSVNCLTATYGSGTAQLQCVTLGSEVAGPTGTGNLTWLTVQANGRGISPITLTSVQVLEIDGDPIPVDIFNGARRVILCPDPNGDGKVSSIDLSQLAQQFGKTTGDPGYTLTRDPNEDGQITSIDLSLTAQVFGLKCVQP